MGQNDQCADNDGNGGHNAMIKMLLITCAPVRKSPIRPLKIHLLQALSNPSEELERLIQELKQAV